MVSLLASCASTSRVKLIFLDSTTCDTERYLGMASSTSSKWGCGKTSNWHCSAYRVSTRGHRCRQDVISVSNHSDGGLFFAHALFSSLLRTQPFKIAPAWRTDEVEQRHPNEEQGDDGEGNNESDDFVGHGIFSEASRGGGLTMGGGGSLNQKGGCRNLIKNFARNR
jgi:hypothetical protein